MRSKIIAGFGALALATVIASVPAFARHAKRHHPYSPVGVYNVAPSGPSVAANPNVGPEGAPLSPGGISAAADAFRGPGYGGPTAPGPYWPATYSLTGPEGAPLSPNGISAAASAFRGPGYSGPTAPGPYRPATYSLTGPGGAPLSPNGISAAASAFRGPGYGGP